MIKRKYMNQWVVLKFNDTISRAKIVDIEFHQKLKKPIFHLVSQFGNSFVLTRDELNTHEISNS
jgi:hypothetical protein